MKMGRQMSSIGLGLILLFGLATALSAQWYKEKNIREMRKSARAIVTLGQASIRLDVHPKDALVYLDGNLVGTVRDFNGRNKRLYVFPGAHTLELRDPNYEPFSTDIKVLPEQDFRLKLHLQKHS